MSESTDMSNREKHMSQMSQGDAVVQAVRAVLGEGTKFVWDEISQKDKESITETVFAMYKAGMWSVKSNELNTDEKIRKYIPGLVNNWVRKSKELNGGGDYVPKRPGSRTGSGDEVLASMKGLRALLASQNKDTKEVDEEIAKRVAELEAKKRPAIDVSKLPPSLRHLVPTT